MKGSRQIPWRVALCGLALLCPVAAARGPLRQATISDSSSGIRTGTETQLHKAARTGDIKLLRARLQQGVNPNARDPSGRTALLEAAKTGQLEAMRALVSAGANVNAAAPDGQTPLIEAAKHNQPEAVKLLMEAGADLNLRSRGSGSALEVAERMGHEQIAQMLRQAGARTFGRSVGDTVCVRPWNGDGYCGTVVAIHKNQYQIHVTKIVGCVSGCEPKPECSAGKPVGGPDGLRVGDRITTVSWCLTHTGVKP
jgi:ankyrin repeat protein